MGHYKSDNRVWDEGEVPFCTICEQHIAVWETYNGVYLCNFEECLVAHVREESYKIEYEEGPEEAITKDFENRLLDILRYVRSVNYGLGEADLQEMALDLAREARDVVTPYYQRKPVLEAAGQKEVCQVHLEATLRPKGEAVVQAAGQKEVCQVHLEATLRPKGEAVVQAAGQREVVCPYEDCIEQQPLDPRRPTPRSCPQSGHDCPGGAEQVASCLEARGYTATLGELPR